MRYTTMLVAASALWTGPLPLRADEGEAKPTGALVRVNAGEPKADVQARAGDLIAFRVPNPALARRVSGLRVATEGGVRKVACVNYWDVQQGRRLPGSDAIVIYVSAEKPGDATVKIEWNNLGGRQSRTYRFDAKERERD